VKRIGMVNEMIEKSIILTIYKSELSERSQSAKFKTVGHLINIQITSSGFSSRIRFSEKEFIRYCSFLSKAFDERKKGWYSGISYTGRDKANFIITESDMGEKPKTPGFAVVKINRDVHVFRKRLVVRTDRSSAPDVQVSLPGSAFANFRSVCLDLAKKLKHTRLRDIENSLGSYYIVKMCL
jgi:hypothetical protein